jgi:O-antigen/teichoic acid export membrane protein
MRIGQNFLWQLLGQGGAKGFGLLFYLLLPRLLGLELYGQFSFALSLALMVWQPLLELGLDLVITKWVSRERPQVIQQALILRGSMALLGLLLLPVLIFAGGDRAMLLLLYAYLVCISGQRVSFAIRRGQENMRLEGIVSAVQKMLAIALLFGFHSLSLALPLIAPMALLVSQMIATVWVAIVTWQDLCPARPFSVNFSGLRQTAKEGILLGGVGLLGMLYFRVDSVMLGALVGELEVGKYNLAYRLIEGAIFLPSVIMMVGFPRLAQTQQFKVTFWRLFAVLSVTGIGVTFLLVAIAPRLIPLIYGSTFQETVPLLQVLAFTLLPIYLGHLATQGLVALDRQKLYLFFTLLAVLVNVSLNAWLIPPQGAMGAAIATCITETLMMAACFGGITQARWARG